ncbi:glycosyltransferase family 1 protein [Rhodopseudomonas sp.]|uniref:glycosyltransferase family 4 protein n=1 Tax=Rhodopseudomonas sp. TaxID=1078 RepID=UPI0025F92097|nr:glycosyltransferase family 1 protein [Rhodopseudomonas sp.]
MNGTLRVEQSCAKALTGLMPGQIRFCRYHQVKRCFVPLDSYPDISARPIVATEAQGRTMLSSLRPLGRRIERTMRNSVRAATGRIFQQVENSDSLPALGSDSRNEVLLLAGENWSQYNFGVIARLRRERGIKVAALCQDFIPVACPQFFGDGEFVAKFSAYAEFLIRETDLVLAISNATRSDILDYASSHGGMRGSIEIVTLGADLPSSQHAKQPDGLSNAQAERFVLSVSTIQSRKNFDLLYHVWRRLTEQNTPGLPTLVIVGQPGFGSRDLLWQIAHDPVTRDKIVILNRASDDELIWLYQNCLWTLYPSFYEGWGLPVSESLAFGKYCLASNASSIPEAGAGFAGLIDPLDFASWCNAVVELMNSPDQLARLEASIRAGYQPITWTKSAGEIANKLSKLSAKNPAMHNE